MEKKGKKNSIPVWGTLQHPVNQDVAFSKKRAGHKAGQHSSALQAEFFNKKNDASMACAYKKAKLSTGSTGDWFVYYYYRNPVNGNFKRFKERFFINRIEDLKERKEVGMEAVAFVNEKLAKGFNPFVAERSTGPGDAFVLNRVNLVVDLLCQTASRNSAETYRLMRNRLQRFLEDAGLLQTPMRMVEVDFCNEFQQWMKKQELSTKTINATISHLGLFWDEATRHKWAIDNPWRKVKSMRGKANQASDIYAPITFDELTKIFEYFRQHELQDFARFCAFIYYAWARPVEICRLKIADIDMENNLIFFRSAQTKNDRSATVQIVPELREHLLAMELEKYPPTYHLFCNTHYGPGPKMRDNNNACATWDWHVHNRLHIPKAMYALKHTGNIDYLINNKGHVDRTWQQMQNRHSSAAMTERYCRRLNAYFVDTSLIKFRKL
jgi:integrase